MNDSPIGFDSPLVTIVTVVFNSVDLIEETIQSVITQIYPNIEYIIIDGASTDGTLDIIKKYDKNINCWITEKDNGISDAFNKGIRLASGEWINFLNAGDVFNNENVLSNIFSKFNFKGYDVVYGNTLLISNEEESKIQINNHKNFKITDSHNPICHQSSFVRRRLLKELKFNDYKYSMDLDFWLRCIKEGVNFYHFDLIVSNYLVGGVSSNPKTAVSVLIEHRIVKMLVMKHVNFNLILKLSMDVIVLKGKLVLKRLVGYYIYLKLKKIFS